MGVKLNFFQYVLVIGKIMEMITNLRTSWLLKKFSSSTPYEMYREQYGEYTY